MPVKGFVKQNGKREFIGIRLSEEERFKLDYLCSCSGLNYTDFIRDYINRHYKSVLRKENKGKN